MNSLLKFVLNLVENNRSTLGILVGSNDLINILNPWRPCIVVGSIRCSQITAVAGIRGRTIPEVQGKSSSICLCITVWTRSRNGYLFVSILFVIVTGEGTDRRDQLA